MKATGDIIITDPCYIMRRNPMKHPEPKDFNLPNTIYSKPYSEYSTPEELAYKAACSKYWAEESKYDDWKKCGYGECMNVLGLTNYISESTIYGDWSCTTWSTPRKDVEEQIEELNKLCKEAWEAEEKYGRDSIQSKIYGDKWADATMDMKKLGIFCADAGMVAVFLLDEVLKYNPDFNKWMEKHDWCVTLIKGFDGEINYHIDNDGDAHIIGKGNINFYTTQTGL